MRRVVLGLLALGLALAPWAAPARADSTFGSTAGVSGVLFDDCRDYPYSYTAHVPAGAGYQALSTSLIGPGGALADTDYVALGANESSGTSTFLLCTPTDPYGTYTIRATLEWGPDPDHPAQSSARLDDTHFSMRRPYTRTRLSASTRRPAHGQRVTYRILTTDERPTGYLPTAFTWVHLEKRVHGRWARIKDGRAVTHSTGRVAVRLRYVGHHQRMRVRAVTEPTARLTRSTSPVLRIW